MAAVRLLPPLAMLAALLSPAPCRAQAANTNSSARLVSPLSVVKVTDLDFGGVSATTAGTVVINPVSGDATYTGGAIAAGGTPRAATFLGSAVKRTVVIIRVPKQPITLTRAGGTETLTVSAWTLDGQDKRELAARTTFTFGVGATLTIPANAVEGTYTGSFNVEVQYP